MDRSGRVESLPRPLVRDSLGRALAQFVVDSPRIASRSFTDLEFSSTGRRADVAWISESPGEAAETIDPWTLTAPGGEACGSMNCDSGSGTIPDRSSRRHDGAR